jgi:hypothetical protein
MTNRDVWKADDSNTSPCRPTCIPNRLRALAHSPSNMVLPGGFEPPARGLRNRRSTTELRQQLNDALDRNRTCSSTFAGSHSRPVNYESILRWNTAFHPINFGGAGGN